MEKTETEEDEESKVKLTEEEKEICKLYGRRHEDGRTRCSECPMVMDSRFCICKGNCTEEEYNEWKEGEGR